MTTLIAEQMAAVESVLNSAVQTDVELLEEASRHIIGSGGKRIRPQLLFLAYLAAGGQAPESVVGMAAAVELVHTATLVHDDINDHSPTRRGRVAVHARWGRTFALLTGDYLFTKVYELMAPYGDVYNVAMADACVRLVEGETLQAQAAKTGEIDQETYKRIILRKTASLFETSASMGAMMAGADEQTVSALADYGRHLGLAFQIVDDILDVTGDPETLGKPVGSDIVQGAGALMASNGRKHGSATAVAEHDPIRALMERLRESGAVEVAMSQADEMARRAHTALTRLPNTQARAELETLVNLVVERQN
ncbi:MAG: polyprenyl synthetase family protein [Candidatus Promineifilaceae bacterium]|nr:polyprenyl synthetase family protein [Candidatus Promineifilaceae bacterium]